MNVDTGLEKLFASETDADSEWTNADLAVMWRHQLDRPILLERDESRSASHKHESDVGLRGEIVTFGEVLFGDNARTDAVLWVRRYAKDHLRGNSTLPRSLVTVLYYCTIAKSHGCQSLAGSRLAISDQLDGFDWCLQQSWIDSRTESLLSRGRGDLKQRN